MQVYDKFINTLVPLMATDVPSEEQGEVAAKLVRSLLLTHVPNATMSAQQAQEEHSRLKTTRAFLSAAMSCTKHREMLAKQQLRILRTKVEGDSVGSSVDEHGPRLP
jgi:hypothetical protein